MAKLSLIYANPEKTAIRAAGDIVAGWQSARDGYGFFGLGFLPFPGDVKVQVSLQVRARPNRHAHLAKNFPTNFDCKGGTDSLNWRLCGSTLELFADFREHVHWLDGAGKPGLNWRPDEPIATSGLIRYYLSLVVSFTFPSHSNAKVEWENDLLPFFSGGQFESNRRRH